MSVCARACECLCRARRPRVVTRLCSPFTPACSELSGVASHKGGAGHRNESAGRRPVRAGCRRGDGDLKGLSVVTLHRAGWDGAGVLGLQEGEEEITVFNLLAQRVRRPPHVVCPHAHTPACEAIAFPWGTVPSCRASSCGANPLPVSAGADANCDLLLLPTPPRAIHLPKPSCLINDQAGPAGM